MLKVQAWWIFFLALNTWASEWEWGGRSLVSGVAPTSTSGEWIEKNLWTTLNVDGSELWGGRLHSQFFLTYSDSPYFLLPKRTSGEQTLAEVSELEYKHFFWQDQIQVTAGKSLLNWERMDGPSPLNVFSTKRQQLLHPDSFWQNRGEWMGQLRLTPTNLPQWFVHVVHSWRAESSDILLPRNNISSQVELERSNKASSFAASNTHQETAVRLGFLSDHQDVDFTWFEGYEHVSLLELQSIQLRAGQPFLILRPLPLKKTVWGGSWSYALEEWVLRAEAAYIEYGKSTYLRDRDISQVQSAFGVERSFFENLRTIVELSYTRQLHSESADATLSTTTSALRTVNNTILGPWQRDRLGLVLHFFYSTDQHPEWNYELASLTYFQEHSGALTPKISYEWTEGWKSSLYSQIYWGSSSTPLGQLKNLNALGITLEYFY